MNELDLVINSSGDHGTFFWEMPEDIKKELRGFNDFLSKKENEEKAKVAVNELKEDIKTTIEKLLFIICGAFLASSKTQDLIISLNKHLTIAAEEGIETITKAK